MANYNSIYTGAQIDAAVGNATKVVANPTISGSEVLITSLQVGSVKYKAFPHVTGADNGKFLRVDAGGDIVAEAVPNANTASF